MRREKLTIALTVVVVILLISISLSYFDQGQTPSLISDRNSAIITTSTSYHGIYLKGSLSNKTISSGNNITIRTEILNPGIFNVKIRNELKRQNIGITRFSGHSLLFLNLPLCFAIAKGNYTWANATNLNLLQMLKPEGMTLSPLGYAIGNYSFIHGSISAKEYSKGSDQYIHTAKIYKQITLNGFWTGNYTDPDFHIFSSGVYTVFFQDNWGQKDIGHFTVLSNYTSQHQFNLSLK
jgi:hypothetical protein